MFWVLAALFVLLLYLLYHPLRAAHGEVLREVELRNELLADEGFREAMRLRRYAPLHTLPAVRWHNNFDTLEGSGSCFSVPTLVTVENTGTFDCAAVCRDPRAVYFYVTHGDRIVVNGVLLARGGYCTTNSVPRLCNSETSLVLHSVNQWTCVAEDPRYYAGEGNLVQVAGRQHADRILASEMDKIVLWDNLLGRVVNPSVNNFRRTWDDELEGGGRRFEVRCDALDSNHNLMVINPLNPIECLPNVCTVVNWVHRDVRPDFEGGVCDCGDVGITRVDHIDEHDPTSRCASITDRPHPPENEYNFRVECLALDTPVDQFSPDKLLCPPGTFNLNTDFAYTFTLRGVTPLSGQGISEPTTRLWRDTRNRVAWYRRP